MKLLLIVLIIGGCLFIESKLAYNQMPGSILNVFDFEKSNIPEHAPYDFGKQSQISDIITLPNTHIPVTDNLAPEQGNFNETMLNKVSDPGISNIIDHLVFEIRL